MKKIALIFLSAILSLSLLSVAVFAEESSEAVIESSEVVESSEEIVESSEEIVESSEVVESSEEIAESSEVVESSEAVVESSESSEDETPKGFAGNLKYMGLGMLGIFVVIGILILLTMLLNALTSKKK